MKQILPSCQIVLFWIQSILISISTFWLQLQVILQKHLHSDTLARKVEPPFVQQPPHPGENTLCLGAGCWNTEILPCKPHKGWILLHSGPPPSQGIIVNGQGRLVSVPAGDKSSLSSTVFASTKLSRLMLPVPMLDKDCLKFGNMEFEESESEWFQMNSGTF